MRSFVVEGTTGTIFAHIWWNRDFLAWLGNKASVDTFLFFLQKWWKCSWWIQNLRQYWQCNIERLILIEKVPECQNVNHKYTKGKEEQMTEQRTSSHYHFCEAIFKEQAFYCVRASSVIARSRTMWHQSVPVRKICFKRSTFSINIKGKT